MEKSLIGIVGSGVMGRGIACSFVSSGYPVIISDIEKSSLDASVTYILDTLDKLVELEKIDAKKRDDYSGLVEQTLKVGDLGSCDYVIEAVAEKLGLKKSIIRRLEGTVNRGAVIATNTSTLSVNKLSQGMKYPDRFCGMHFFNPADRMELVELIRADQTENEVIDRTEILLKKIGKTPIRCKDEPGFIVNRLSLLFINEAIRLLDEGMADARSIDDAVTLGLNHRMGPLELADLIGLDTLLDILDNMYRAKGSRYKPQRVLKDMVRDNKLGRKTKRGFYEY